MRKELPSEQSGVPLGFRVFLVLRAQPLIGSGDVEHVCDGQPGDETAQVDEGVALDPPHF